MTFAYYTQALKEARRDALVNNYLATHDFSLLPEGSSVTTADDLYEYLLLDTKISDSITTSPLSEAVNSLQLCIHRAMEGYDGELVNSSEVNGWFAAGAFLNNWDQYNKRYSTWAGKGKLSFHAGNYIEPSLRMEKTELFKEFELSLETGGVNDEIVYNSICKYVHDYQERADLDYISSCINDETNEIYYIGIHDGDPVRYYWRKASVSNGSEVTEWGEWHTVDLKGGSAINNIVTPLILNGSLHICWYTEELIQGGDDKSKKICFYNESGIDKNGFWKVTTKEPLNQNISLPVPARKNNSENMAVASLPFSPWREGLECIDQVYDDKVNSMYFLCRDGNGDLFLNVFSISGSGVFTRKINQYCIYGKGTKELELVREANEFSLSVEDQFVYLEYSIGSGSSKSSYKYVILAIGYPILMLKGSNSPHQSKAIGIQSFENSDVFNVSEVFLSENKKYISVKGEFNNSGLVYFEANMNDLGESITVKCIKSPIELHVNNHFIKEDESVNISIENNLSHLTFGIAWRDIGRLNFILKEMESEAAWDIKPSKYGVVNNDMVTLIPKKNSACPAIGFSRIQHNYPEFDLTAWLANTGRSNILEYLYHFDLQDGNHIGGMEAFSGHNGMYLWEIFFHIPFLIATRFAAEQRFDEAERWYKYIFNSAGYRNEDGKLLTDDNGNPRYWNCYPLQQDPAWDALVDIPASTDPDIIATADPMHYKLAIFLHTLDLLITRGDAAYRLLERDSLTEAKMYYMQAQQLLGPRPDIRITNSWDNPTLEKEADAITSPATRDDMPHTFSQWLRVGDRIEMGDGNFLPPYNEALLIYWEKVEVRLFNLRHNLSLTGQPLDLPLFSTPADPTELHRQQSGGDGIQDETSPVNNTDTGWRYPLLADHARNAASQLIQFGGNFLNALERRDSEQLTLLLQTQQIAVLNQQQDIAQKNLDSLSASLASLNSSLASAHMRKTHYTHLIEGNLSVQEQAGLNLRTTSRGLTLASQGLMTAAGALSGLPNTFGLANGGGDFGAPVRAAGIVMQAMATADEQSAVIGDISASYQRRAEEWILQRDLADKDVEQMNAQIDSLKAQIAMQQKQQLLTETESANAQAVYDMQSGRFTGQALYNWMVGRLSALYYQLYDTTVPVCLQARNALSRELGSDKVDGLFGGVVWNDLYQGLLAGEGLTTELQKMDNVWLQQGALGLEATRTVSLADLRGEESGSLSTIISDLLAGNSGSADNGVLTLKDGIFSAALDMSKLGLESSYNDKTRRRFIKSISITLPTLLGPYQGIEATLSCGGQMATLSHGMQDMGRFVANFDDSRFLPFEGVELKTGNQNTVTLSVFNVKGADESAPNQRSLVENLSDIIFHIHYILR